MYLLRRLIAVVAILLLPIGAMAQTTGAVLSGTVTDASGATIPGVTVTATNDATGVARVVTTGADGSYRTPTLVPGRYTVSASLDGFSVVTVQNVDLNIATTRTLDLSLRPSAVQESIIVTADAPLVATTPSIGTVVSQRELENLPLNGRQFANLASLAPGTSLGVNPDPTKPGQLVVALNGGVGRNVNYIIDGGDNTDDTIGGALQNFNLEAVQEFKIQTQQYKAEFGRSTGGVLTVVTKTGTNEFGGSVYGFLRDKSLNSETESESRSNFGKQAYERTQYGLSFGGPIVRDRAHFFATYDKTDRTTAFALSPNVTVIFPDVSPTLSVPFEDEMITGKATWAISSRQQLQGRYGSQQYSDIYSAQALSTPDNVGILNSEYASMLVGHTGQFGTSIVNDFLYQYSTFENSILPASDAPTETFANGVNAGANVNTPQTTEQIKHQFKNDLGWTTTLGDDRHDFKVGVNWIHEPTLGGSFSSNLGGRYFYAGNTRDSAITRIEFNSGFSSFSIPVDQYSIYAQDDWQLTDKLLLNLGLRYDLWDGYDFDQTGNSLWQALRSQTTYNEPYLQAFREGSGTVESDDDNWGPRLGFTYDLMGDARQIIRGGWGKYFDFPYTNATLLFPTIVVQSNFGASYLNADAAGIRNADGSLYRIGQPLPPNQLVSVAAVPNEVASPTIAAPESTQISLGYSFEVTNNVGLTLDLVNIEYENIPYRFRGNPTINGARRFPQFGNFRIWQGDGEAEYKGVNLGIRSRMTDRFELQGFYTWSEATGNVLAGADEFRLTNATHQPDLSAVPDQSINPFDPNCDACFGPLNTDATHRVTMSALYRAPWAINVGTIIRYRSGLPYTEWTGTDIDGDGFAFDLPAGVDHVNNLRGDDLTQVDLRLSREFSFGRGVGVEVLAEIFNLLNEENPARYVGNRAANNFQQPTVFAGDPLQPEQQLLQLGLRVRY
jgi:outer membrane receptor protein involved in Fe transport